MPEIARDGVTLHYERQGPTDGPAVIFSNSLGTTLHLWDPILPYLPDHLRILRYDMRGHGQSEVPDAPYTMGQLISDAEAVCDAAEVRDAVFIGLSVGGMIGQGLAVKREDIVRSLVLSNTAAKIGNPAFWQERIDAVQRNGMGQMADPIVKRWFGRDFYESPAMAPWQDMLSQASVEGYCGVCTAIAGTDFYTPTSGLRIPTLGIAGSEDGSTPPDLVRETVDLIPGSQFVLMRRAGHLPCVEQPEAFAGHLTAFLQSIGHL
ncbi:3-oxoadipate enol-lactonase [Yoonia maricola]|uniref:3-oxoadipate enol-lactonase n=1 Tax=Yoonia maricola TaxID=420999 RepID=A0A2M8W2E7_9RHOB|nr:3-oxoadipate enol-lactonase [Yoonia maricola]PJI85099.1 3-oxoadipate enol-lactonase [Yoonia maricola]